MNLPHRCGTCQFWKADSKLWGQKPDWPGLPGENGECHRHPPTSAVSGINRFPRTERASGCGEYKLHSDLAVLS